jgi:hypothetical protein
MSDGEEGRSGRGAGCTMEEAGAGELFHELASFTADAMLNAQN